MSHALAERGERRIGILALPGCMASAVLGSVEALKLAAAMQPTAAPVQLRVISPSGDPVQAYGDVAIPASGSMGESEPLDALIVPPVVGNPVELATTHASVAHWIRDHAEAGATTGAACTGTFLLAESGALDGRRATTTPAFSQLFAARYPRVQLQTALRVVDEGTVVTAGAMSCYLDLALALAGRFLGPHAALRAARALSTELNPRSQQPFLLPRAPVQHGDDAVRTAEAWIRGHFAERFDSADLARIAGLGQRTFVRRFRAATGESPNAYVQRARIEEAMKDLEATTRTIEEITHRCGYEDARSFRRLFRRQIGISPREYRQRFGYPALR